MIVGKGMTGGRFLSWPGETRRARGVLLKTTRETRPRKRSGKGKCNVLRSKGRPRSRGMETQTLQAQKRPGQDNTCLKRRMRSIREDRSLEGAAQGSIVRRHQVGYALRDPGGRRRFAYTKWLTEPTPAGKSPTTCREKEGAFSDDIWPVPHL